MKAFNIWVTKRCNLKCKYCYEGINKENVDMNLDDIHLVVNYIKNSSSQEEKVHVNFHGGEPLLKFDVIKAICNDLNSLGAMVSYSMTTNGILLENDILRFIKKNKIYLSLSMDGIQIVHDLKRVDGGGRGSYERVKEKLGEIIKYGICPRIRMTVCPDTVVYLYDSILHLQELKCKNIVIIPDYYNNWNEENLYILQDQLIKIKNILGETEIEVTFFDDKPFVKKGKCFGGDEECCIDVDGSIYPCTFAVGNTNMKIGNVVLGIDENRLEDIRKINGMRNPMCDGCTYEKCCISTRCKILNEMLTGEFLQPSPLICALENIIYTICKGKSVTTNNMK